MCSSSSTQTLAHVPTAQYLRNDATPASQIELGNLVAGQAAVQSYADTSRWVAIITIALTPLVLLLNKPRGYVTTRSDPQKRPTVIDLLKGVHEYVYPVGRLDYDSEGLLILTNDGDLAARLTHPRHGVPRVYEARVLGEPDAHDLSRLSKGVTIDGRRTEPAKVVSLGPGHLRITVHEGRNRQVRKMCDAIGHPVDELRRVAIGPIRDSRLKVGQCRELSPQEVESLRRATRTSHDRT